MTQNRNHEPRPSRASRKIPRRSKGSITGQLTFGEDRGRGQCLVFESDLERQVALLVIYSPGVIDVEDQVGPVTWTDARGKTRHHTFDFAVTRVTADGKKVRYGLAVKPEHRANSAKFCDEMERVTRAAVPLLVDRVFVVTQANINKKDLTRAKQLHGARIPVPEIDCQLSCLPSFTEWTCISDVLATAGLGPEGFAGILRLILAHVFMTEEAGLISMSSRIRNREGVR